MIRIAFLLVLVWTAAFGSDSAWRIGVGNVGLVAQMGRLARRQVASALNWGVRAPLPQRGSALLR